MPEDFEIRLVTSADLAAAKQTATALQDVGKAAKASAQDQVKATDEVNKADTKALGLKGQLKQAIKGLSLEFPILARVGQMALNPITIAVAGIAGAFKIWTTRVNELTRSLGGVEMPDLSEPKIGQVRAMAEAWEDFAGAMRKAAEAYDSVDAAAKRDEDRINRDLARNKKLLESEKDLALARLEADRSRMDAGTYDRARSDLEGYFGALGGKQDREAELARLGRRAQQEDQLRASARAKMSAAGRVRVGTAEQEGDLEKDYALQNADAKQRLKEAQDRLADLRAYQSGEYGFGGPKAIAFTYRYAKRYGTMSQADAEALERGDISRAQTTMNRYRAFAEGAPGRGRLRQRRAELVSGAGREIGEAETIRREMWGAGGALDQFDLDQAAGRNVSRNEGAARIQRVIAAGTQQESQLLEQIANAIEHGNAVTASTLQRLERTVKSLEQSRKLNPPST